MIRGLKSTLAAPQESLCPSAVVLIELGLGGKPTYKTRRTDLIIVVEEEEIWSVKGVSHQADIIDAHHMQAKQWCVPVETTESKC